jgi:hypothetical protein
MSWTERVARIGGLVLLLLAAFFIINLAVSIAISDSSFGSRSEAADYLADIHDNKELFGLVIATNVVTDTIFSAGVAGLLWLLFRERDMTLATLGSVIIVAASGAFMATDSASFAVLVLAEDFAEGGPVGVAAGDPATLEAGRAIGVIFEAGSQVAFTGVATGIGLYSLMFAFSREGALNPPRWIGWAGIVAAAAAYLSWLAVASEVAFVFFIIAGLAMLVWLIALGVWLLARGDEVPHEQMAPSPA